MATLYLSLMYWITKWTYNENLSQTSIKNFLTCTIWSSDRNFYSSAWCLHLHMQIADTKNTDYDWFAQREKFRFWEELKKGKSQDFIVSSSSIARKLWFPRLFLNTTWISKRCSIISVKKCLARCVQTYLPSQNSCHAYTVSVYTAWNNGIRRAMAATPSDARNVKPLVEYLRVAIWKIFQLVFISMAWLMC